MHNTLYLAEYRKELPGWRIDSDDTWVYASNPSSPTVATNGWKVHISCQLSNAVRTLRSTLRVCKNYSVNLKSARDPGVHRQLNSKQGDRASANKFLTLYPDPADPQLLANLIKDLNAVLTANGPQIFSDLRVGSQTYIRYGAHLGIPVMRPNGTTEIRIQNPDNGRIVEDPRDAVFRAPEWVRTHPISGAPLDEILDEGNSEADNTKINGYTPLSALHFSCSGGVYLAHTGDDDDEEKRVVLKEAIPHTMFLEADSEDAVDRLSSEYKMLEKLAVTGVTPKPVAIFDYQTHRFIAMEYIEAPTLSEKAPIGLPEALPIAISIAEAVAIIHREQQIVIGDLSAKNVLLEKSGEGVRVRIIDLEAAYEFSAPRKTLFATKGYAPAERGTGQEDDVFSVGAIFTTLFVGHINSLFDLHGNPAEIAKRFFSRAALPPALTTIVTQCLSDAPNARPTAEAVAKRLVDLQRHLQRPQATASVAPVDGDIDDIDGDIDPLAKYIAAAPAPNNNNNLGLANGTAGIALTLEYLTDGPHLEPQTQTACREKLNQTRWQLLSADLNSKDYPPGFANGLAGIAYAIDRTTDAKGYAQRVMKNALAHRMLQDIEFPVTVLHGSTGIALTSLYFYQQTSDPVFLEGAIAAGQRCSAADAEKTASTAVLYLAVADVLRDAPEAQALWRRHAKESLTAVAGKTTPALRNTEAEFLALAVAKSKQFFGTEFFNAFPKRPWRFADDFIAADPTLGGLSAIGLAYLHRFAETGDPRYITSAVKIAKTLKCFIHRNGDRAAFPAADLKRESAGLFSGAAGAVVFLARLAEQQLAEQRLAEQQLSVPPAPFLPWEWL